jgi:hypothetical protein
MDGGPSIIKFRLPFWVSGKRHDLGERDLVYLLLKFKLMKHSIFWWPNCKDLFIGVIVLEGIICQSDCK